MGRSSTPTAPCSSLSLCFRGGLESPDLSISDQARWGRRRTAEDRGIRKASKRLFVQFQAPTTTILDHFPTCIVHILHLLLVGPKPPDVVGERITRWLGGPRRRITQQDDKLFDRNWKECFFQQESHKKVKSTLVEALTTNHPSERK